MKIEFVEEITHIEMAEERYGIVEIADTELEDRIPKSIITAAGQLVVGLNPGQASVVAAPGASSLSPVSDLTLAGKWKFVELAPAAAPTFTGHVTVHDTFQVGTSYTNSFQTSFWIAPDIVTNPTVQTQALWAVHRVGGDMGAFVHDAFAVNLNVYSATNTTYLNAAEFSWWVLGTGNVIADARAITANLNADAGATGTITNASVIRAQSATLVAGVSVTGIFASIVAEEQTKGATNYSFYSPSGANLLGGVLTVGGVIYRNGNAGTARDITWQTAGVVRWIMRADGTAEGGANAGTDWSLLARTDAGGALGTALTITRSSLAAVFGGSVTITLGLTVNGNTILGDASTDTITCTGRLIFRTAASDPQHATPGSRPAGSVGEIVFYNAKWYGCTNAATPTWEKITSV